MTKRYKLQRRLMADFRLQYENRMQPVHVSARSSGHWTRALQQWTKVFTCIYVPTALTKQRRNNCGLEVTVWIKMLNLHLWTWLVCHLCWGPVYSDRNLRPSRLGSFVKFQVKNLQCVFFVLKWVRNVSLLDC